jgi:hypothetical protein
VARQSPKRITRSTHVDDHIDEGKHEPNGNTCRSTRGQKNQKKVGSLPHESHQMCSSTIHDESSQSDDDYAILKNQKTAPCCKEERKSNKNTRRLRSEQIQDSDVAITIRSQTTRSSQHKSSEEPKYPIDVTCNDDTNLKDGIS